MSRGTKFSLDFGSSWDDGWNLESETKAKIIIIEEPSKHALILQKEKRRGKAVSLVGPFCLSDEAAQKTLTILKKKLACGGAYKEGWMEFQGDIGPKIREALEALSFCFKKPK
ncbi:MAG: translation initiation factor 1 [Campylobacterota bacterium]|nr:translation initiation factor 1 [Campylobacterota bacterium]